MSGGEMSDVERRVWARLPDGTGEALGQLSATDLQTLLLSVARIRAGSGIADEKRNASRESKVEWCSSVEYMRDVGSTLKRGPHHGGMSVKRHAFRGCAQQQRQPPDRRAERLSSVPRSTHVEGRVLR
jgi:hypothetical protein